MMALYALAVFASDLPEDWIEEDGKIIQFPGQAVASTIAEILRGDGYSVSEPEHLYEQGWDLIVDHGNTSVWLNVSLGEQAYVLQHATRSFADPTQDAHAEILRVLTNGLRRDGRFGEVFWLDEIDQPFGFADPVTALDNEKRPTPEAWRKAS